MTGLSKPTGGQINVAGILYQLLVSLAEGIDVTVKSLGAADPTQPIILQIEPFDGGDAEVRTHDRLVMQIKTKVAHQKWTLHEIAKGVLPDLLKAVDVKRNDRFQFVTNNERGCDEFRRFLEWFKHRSKPDAQHPMTFLWGSGGRKVSPEELIDEIIKTVHPDPEAKTRILKLLGSFEIIARDDVELSLSIERNLARLIERPEDLVHKKGELLGELLLLGAKGHHITTSELLRRAELDPDRLRLSTLVPKQLNERLEDSLEKLGYQSALEVRVPLLALSSSITVLRGESGIGKTWQLCALAKSMAENGKLVVIASAVSNYERLKASIVSAVWNPIFSSPGQLSSVSRKMRPIFANEQGVWLTVLLDDLNDPHLADEILKDDWESHGVDIVTSSQPQTADWIRRNSATARIVEVPSFNLPEVIRFLDKNGVQHSNVGDDVFELLFKPILARLFCAIPHGVSVRAETEFELMARFWEHAAKERPAQAAHPFDQAKLQIVVGQMLLGPVVYPWPFNAYRTTLKESATLRLCQCGIVSIDDNAALSFTHDRLLNWSMAIHLKNLVLEQSLSSAQLVQLVNKVENLETIDGTRLGNRLNHVFLDVAWLLLAPDIERADLVAEYMALYLEQDHIHASLHAEIFRSLHTLGPRAILLLEKMAKGLGSSVKLDMALLGNTLRELADVDYEAVCASAIRFFRSGNQASIELALVVLSGVSAVELLDDLWQLNAKRAVELASALPEQNMEARKAKNRAFFALRRSALSSQKWLDEKISSSQISAELEQLLEVLVRPGDQQVLSVWDRYREHFFRKIREGSIILPKAVRFFSDVEYLEKLQFAVHAEADRHYGEITFAAICHIKPHRAFALLHDSAAIEGLNLIDTRNWWLHDLHRHNSDATMAALREYAGRYVNGGAVLSRLLTGWRELIDEGSIDFLLRCLAAELKVEGDSESATLDRCVPMLAVLGEAPDLAGLTRLATWDGNPYATRLSKLVAVAAMEKPGRLEDDLKPAVRVLSVMSGQAFDELILSLLSDDEGAARFGIEYAAWTSSTAIGDNLELLVEKEFYNDDDSRAHLMRALVSHSRDASIAKMVNVATQVATADNSHGRSVDWLDFRQAQSLRDDEDVALLSNNNSAAKAAELLQELAASSQSQQRWARILSGFGKAGQRSVVDEPKGFALTSRSSDDVAMAQAINATSREDKSGMFHAAHRLFARSGGIQFAKLMLLTEPEQGTHELVKVFPDAGYANRTAISRSLRWLAPKELLMAELTTLARSSNVYEMALAAQISGWLPQNYAVDWLGDFRNDPHDLVRDTALVAISRRNSERNGLALLEAIPFLPKQRQWTYLHTFLKTLDPHLILHEGDPLDIKPTLRALPFEFTVEAEAILADRVKDVASAEPHVTSFGL